MNTVTTCRASFFANREEAQSEQEAVIAREVIQASVGDYNQISASE